MALWSDKVGDTHLVARVRRVNVDEHRRLLIREEAEKVRRRTRVMLVADDHAHVAGVVKKNSASLEGYSVGK